MTLETLDMFAGYPNGPGWKRAGTSRDAARKLAPRAPLVRDQVLEVLKRGEYTADEAAAHLGLSILTVRPRCSELLGLGLIEDTGKRRKNASQNSAIVWKASDAAR